jgi:hypothetical protein
MAHNISQRNSNRRRTCRGIGVALLMFGSMPEAATPRSLVGPSRNHFVGIANTKDSDPVQVPARCISHPPASLGI